MFDGNNTKPRKRETENGVITFNGKEDAGGEYLSVSDTDWSEVESISLWTKNNKNNGADILLKISDNGGGDGLLDVNLDDDGYFGRSVSYSDNTLVVGVRNDEDGGEERGAVYIFEKDSNGEWSQTLKISDNEDGPGKLDINLDNNDWFGSSVSYSDDTLVVGAEHDDDGPGTNDGAAYIFEKDSNGVWSKTLKISNNGGGNGKLDINTESHHYNFGSSVSYSKDTLVVGADGDSYFPNIDNLRLRTGAAYIFEKDSNGEWSQTLKISDNGGVENVGELDIRLNANDYFGNSVSYSKDTLVVGAYRKDDGGGDKGAVYIFEKDSSGVWSKTLKISDNGGGAGLLDIDLDSNEIFGRSISYSDDRLIVGAWSDDGGKSRGGVYIFEKDSNGVWSQTLKISDNGGGDGLLDIDIDYNSSFGDSVSYSDDTLVVSAFADDDGGINRGAVYIIDLPLPFSLNKKANPVFTFGSEDKNVSLDFRADATNNDEPSIHFDVASDVKTDTTVDVGLYIPTAYKSWNHIVIVNRGGEADIYRNNEFVGRKKINDFPGLLSGFIGRNSADISNASIKELVVTKEELTDEQITSLYNHGLGVRNIENTSVICGFTENES